MGLKGGNRFPQYGQPVGPGDQLIDGGGVPDAVGGKEVEGDVGVGEPAHKGPAHHVRAEGPVQAEPVLLHILPVRLHGSSSYIGIYLTVKGLATLYFAWPC